MEYRLKKDLPFAKAGTVIDKITSYPLGEKIDIYVGSYRCEIGGDVLYDWVELNYKQIEHQDNSSYYVIKRNYLSFYDSTILYHIKILFKTDRYIKYLYVDSGYIKLMTIENFDKEFTIVEELSI